MKEVKQTLASRAVREVFSRFLCLAGIMGLIFALASCAQGSGATVPMNPGNPTQAGIDLSVQQASAADSGDEPGHHLWGYFLIFLDPGKMTAEIVPLRLAETHFNVLKWLQAGPCYDCFKIASIVPGPAGTLNVDISIKHPFSSLNLTGFDVRGIAMFNGSHEFPTQGVTVSDRTKGEGELVNADGYSKLYAPWTVAHGPFEGYLKGKHATINAPNSTLNGYRRFVSSGAGNTRNAFLPGDTVVVTYQVDMPDSPNPFVLGYAVDASWAPPSVKPVTDPMTDFPETANCPEAWKIEVSSSTMGSEGLTDCNSGGVILTIDVYDWQGKDTGHDLLAECPEIINGTFTATWKGDYGGFTRYTRGFENNLHAPVGSYMCLIGKGEDLQGGKDYMDPSAFQICTLTVVVHMDKTPEADAEANKAAVKVNLPVSFDATASKDTDCYGHNILKYEWDWNGTGDFSEDAANVDHSWSSIGVYDVQLRVTDDEGSTDTLDQPIEITVTEFAPPVALAKADPTVQYVDYPISFSDDGSYAPDGLINLYEWDWENDGIYDETGALAQHSWSVPGIYYVQFRVTDSNGLSDSLDTPIEITINPKDFVGWARTWGAGEDDYAYKTAVDALGDIYVTGCFQGTVDFDPGSGVDSHTSNGSWDVFLCKYDSTGAFQWARTWGGNDSEMGKALAVDGYDVYVTGYYYTETVDFDPGDGIDNHTSNGLNDAFLSKFDADGIFQWARTWGGVGNDGSWGIAANNGDVYVTGLFSQTVDFDPTGGDSRDSNGGTDVFLTEYNSYGDYQWTRTWGGTDWDEGWGAAVSGSGDVYVTGYFQNTADFDPGIFSSDIHTSNGLWDVFVSNFNSYGTFGWAETWGGDGYDSGRDVAIDAFGDLYVAGDFWGTVDFDPTGFTDNHTSNGSYDAFVSEFDASGSFQWAKTWGGTGADDSFGVAADNIWGNVYVTGNFSSTVDFNPWGGGDLRASSGESDVFLDKFDPYGSFQWAKTFGGPGVDMGYGVALDALGTMYITGSFSDTVDFDPGGGIDEYTSNGKVDAYLSELPAE